MRINLILLCKKHVLTSASRIGDLISCTRSDWKGVLRSGSFGTMQRGSTVWVFSYLQVCVWYCLTCL